LEGDQQRRRGMVLMSVRQVVFFLLALGLIAWAYLYEPARERLVANSWQPVPAILMILLSPLSLLMSVNAVLHHRPAAFLILSTLLFGAAGAIQLALVRRHDQATRR